MTRTKSFLLKSEFWLDIFSPNRCPCCNKIIKWDKLVCEECKKNLPFVTRMPWDKLFMPDDGVGERSFDFAAAAFSYEDLAKQGIITMKRGYGRNFAAYAAQILVNLLENEEISPQLVTCVPMSYRKRAARGCNQAAQISKEIANIMNLPHEPYLLKHRNIKTAQHSLDAKGRAELAQSAYLLPKNYNKAKYRSVVSGKRIALCDDVFTTGATMNKCAALLKEAGAAEVYCLCVCRTNGRREYFEH